MAAAAFSLIQGEREWLRSALEQAAVRPGSGVVQLAWSVVAPRAQTIGDAARPAGLAFDRWCRLYRGDPEAGRVHRGRWLGNPGEDPIGEAGLELFETPAPGDGEKFVAATQPGALGEPCALAVDDEGRLFVAERGRRRVLVHDLVERRLLRRIRMPGAARPLDLACDGRGVLVLLDQPPGVVELDARRSGHTAEPLDVQGRPSRIALGERGERFVLVDAGSAGAHVLRLGTPPVRLDAPFASDIETLATGEEGDVTLVIAGRPGEALQVWSWRVDGPRAVRHLDAPGYDGRGLVRTPDGRIGYWNGSALRNALPARERFAAAGRVTSFALDGGAFQTRWGRVFVEACIPPECDVRLRFLSADTASEACGPDAEMVALDDEQNALLELAASHRLYRRDSGAELPWVSGEPGDRFRTYEAPVQAAPGRYLWLVLEMRGSSRASPSIRSVRVERPGHDLLRRLPRLYSRDEAHAAFLHRFLDPLAGLARELDGRSFERRALVDPASCPAELLPWLASFIGLVLDERWPEHARRKLIAAAAWLFRFRGTVPGLRRFLEIYLDVEVIIVEHFRVRGLGGAIVGAADERESTGVVGVGLRVGDRTGRTGAAAEDRYSHWFTVVVPALLDEEQRAVVEHILEVHRPAHTRYDICTVDSGMRVGIGLYLGLATVVGRSGGFDTLALGGSLLGRHAVLGRPRPATSVGASRLGHDSRAGL